MPVGYAIYRISLDDQGRPLDFYYEFANKTYCDWVGKTRQELVGSSFLAGIDRAEDEWMDIYYRTACLGEEQHFVHYTVEIDR